MALLNYKNQTPPDGYAYTQAETQTRMELPHNGNLEELVDMVIFHRQWKHLVPTDRDSVRLEIERQICAAMPEGVCSGEPGEHYEPFNDQSRNLSLMKIEMFSSAMIEWIGSGAKLVEPEESQRRAAICRGCQFNKAPKFCSCSPLWLLLDRLIPKERREHGLYVCGICGCVTGIKTLAPANVLIESEKGIQHRYPAHCWLNQILHGS
jgi:hypothetical protein